MYDVRAYKWIKKLIEVLAEKRTMKGGRNDWNKVIERK